MKHKIYIQLIALVLISTAGLAQSESKKISVNENRRFQFKDVSIQPGVGMRMNFGKDLILTNLIIAHSHEHISLAAYSSISQNNLFQRNFNYIKTNYDYSVSQSVGVGTTLFWKYTSHSFLFMLGVKYTNFKQTLQNPELEQVASKVSALSPDMGFRYNFTYGIKKWFFHAGLYLPLYPYPFKSANIEAIDGNLKNIALEAGVGIKI